MTDEDREAFSHWFVLVATRFQKVDARFQPVILKKQLCSKDCVHRGIFGKLFEVPDNTPAEGGEPIQGHETVIAGGQVIKFPHEQ